MMGCLDATPQTGEMIEDMSAAANKRVADIVASFRQIFIPYPRHVEFHFYSQGVHDHRRFPQAMGAGDPRGNKRITAVWLAVLRRRSTELQAPSYP